jgi:tetratricopeptide (TPR) repeat protein
MAQNPTNPEGSATDRRSLTGGEAFDLIQFWQAHSSKIIFALVAAAAIVIALTVWQCTRHSKLTSAEEAFAAVTDDNYRSVIESYPDTPTAARAIIITAHQEFTAGRYDEAIELYQRFERQFPKHPYHEVAAYNIAACLEAKGEYQRAADAYDKFAKNHQRSYLAPSARLGVGRCYEALGDWHKAKDAYERMILLSRESSFLNDARERLSIVSRKLPRQTPKPDAGTATPSTPAPANSGTAQTPAP